MREKWSMAHPTGRQRMFPLNPLVNLDCQQYKSPIEAAFLQENQCFFLPGPRPD